MCSLVLLLSVTGTLWNIFNIIEYSFAGVFKITVYVLIVILTAFLSVFDISIMLYGRYVIKNGCLYSYFGLIFSKIKIEEISSVIHFKKSDKLVAYFTDDKYAVIVISPTEYDDFVKEIRTVNPKILFNTKIDGEETPC